MHLEYAALRNYMIKIKKKNNNENRVELLMKPNEFIQIRTKIKSQVNLIQNKHYNKTYKFNNGFTLKEFI